MFVHQCFVKAISTAGLHVSCSSFYGRSCLPDHLPGLLHVFPAQRRLRDDFGQRLQQLGHRLTQFSAVPLPADLDTMNPVSSHWKFFESKSAFCDSLHDLFVYCFDKCWFCWPWEISHSLKSLKRKLVHIDILCVFTFLPSPQADHMAKH